VIFIFKSITQEIVCSLKSESPVNLDSVLVSIKWWINSLRKQRISGRIYQKILWNRPVNMRDLQLITIQKSYRRYMFLTLFFDKKIMPNLQFNLPKHGIIIHPQKSIYELIFRSCFNHHQWAMARGFSTKRTQSATTRIPPRQTRWTNRAGAHIHHSVIPRYRELLQRTLLHRKAFLADFTPIY